MKHIVKIAWVICATAALGACSASGTPGPKINAVDPNYGTLQFAVGTANLYGSATPSLNVVSTLRQPNGHSAYGVDTPTITGPFVFNVAPAPANGTVADPYTTLIPQPPPALGNVGPSLAEANAAAPAITGTPQIVAPGTPFCDGIGSLPPPFTSCPAGISPDASTFGESGGVFAMGIAPYNTVSSTGQSYSYAPFAQPMYETAGHFQFVDWGGPPAFDPDGNGMGTRDGLVVTGSDSFGDPYSLGVGEGITIFEGATPSTGSYTLSVQLAIAGPNGPSFLTKTAKANLGSPALLPTATAPLVTPDGSGGAAFNINASNLPAGVTEALVQIIDYGPGGGPNHPQPSGGFAAANCQGPKGTNFAPVYYTFEVTANGANTLGPAHGPNTNLNGGINNLQPSPSICTAAQNTAAGTGTVGDNITVQIIGFDYPAYEAAVGLTGQTVPQAPTIVGASGQSDITVSIPEEEDYPAYAQQPLLRVHRSIGPRFHRHRKP